MAQPKFEDRQDMSEDLKASGFDTPQTRSILRVVEGMVKNLPTRADWKQSEENNRKMHEEAAENNRKMHEEAAENTRKLLAEAAENNRKFQAEVDKKLQKMERTIHDIYVWMRWGLIVFLSTFLAVVSMLLAIVGFAVFGN